MKDRAKKPVKHTVLALCIGLVGVFATTSCDKGERLRVDELIESIVSQDTCNLEGTKWVLIEKEINGIKEMWQEDHVYPITLTFFTDTTFKGRHDANRYEGKYKVLGGNILLNFTFMTDVFTGYWYESYMGKIIKINRITLTDSTMQLSDNDSFIFNFISRKKFENDYFELEEWYNY